MDHYLHHLNTQAKLQIISVNIRLPIPHFPDCDPARRLPEEFHKLQTQPYILHTFPRYPIRTWTCVNPLGMYKYTLNYLHWHSLGMLSISHWHTSGLILPHTFCTHSQSSKSPVGGPHTLPTSSSYDSIGVQLDLDLEIVQAIVRPPYHGLGTNFGPSCKCVWDHCPAGRWCPGGSCHKIQGCFAGHPPESWCKGPHLSSHQSCKHIQPLP